MNARVITIVCVMVLCCAIAVSPAAGQASQSSSSTQTTNTGAHNTSSGQGSITGCVAKEGDNFVLKTDEGTYQFNTARDLSPYVGKRVRIAGQWKATGITTMAPIKGSSSSDHESSDKTAAGAAAQSFKGDLKVHINGEVVGDCPSQ
jgi:hypothetical protein